MEDLTLEDMEQEGMEEGMEEGPNFMEQLKVIPTEEIVSYLKVEGILPEEFEIPEVEAPEEGAVEEMPPEEGGGEYDFSF